MEAKTLLTRAVTLLYKESQTRDVEARSGDLVRAALNTIVIPEVAEGAAGRDTIVELKKIAQEMAASTDNAPFDRLTFMQKMKMALGSDDTTFDAIQIGIEKGDTEKDDQNQIDAIRSELRDHSQLIDARERVKKLYTAAMFGTGTAASLLDMIASTSGDLQEMVSRRGAKKRGVIDEVFLTDIASTAAVIDRAKEKLSPDGAIRFGLQGFNLAFGDHPGLLRGEQWLHAALSHQYKSGHGLNFFADSMIYNKPWLMDKTKKPMVVHFSTENDAEQNTVQLYELLRARETGERVRVKDVDTVTAATYVNKVLTANGWTPYLCRVDSSEAGLTEAFAVLDDLMADGYEIALVVFDYPDTMVKRTSSSTVQGPTGADKRDMFRRIRNYCKKHAIANLVYHQMGAKAKELIRMGVKDFVKDVAKKNLHDGCSTIYEEVDISSYQHMEKVKIDGRTVVYMTVQFDKHRKAQPTDEELWYFAFPMDPYCGFRPDVDGEPTFIRDMDIVRNQAGNDWYAESQALGI